MDLLKSFLIYCICCLIFQMSYGTKFHRYIPYHGSSKSVDVSKFVDKKIFNMYPENTISDGRPQTMQLFKISENVSKFQQTLPFSENKNYPSKSHSPDKTLEMEVGEHLVKVKSKIEPLSFASIDVGHDRSINPKYSHVIEIIHRGDNLEKQDKPAQIYDAEDKQAVELTKTADITKYEGETEEEFREADEGILEKWGVTEQKCLKANEGIPGESDETEFVEADEISKESDDESNEIIPESDETEGEEISDDETEGEEIIDDDDETEGEEISDDDETEGEEISDDDDEKKFSDDKEEFDETSETYEEISEESDEASEDEGIPGESNEFGEIDGGNLKFETDERDSEDNYEGTAAELNDDNEVETGVAESTKTFDVEINSAKGNGTSNEHVISNEVSDFKEEFEGSGGEFSDTNDRNTTKTGRILGMFSRQNETFPTCTTPKGEAGHCRRLGECLLSEALNNFNGFLQQLCLIRGVLVGICCPDNPVIEVLNPDENSTSELKSEEIKQPPEGCGLNIKTRIVGGTISVPNEWTWMVALMRRNRFYCGGVIINNWFILTAAHCVMGINVKDLTVRLGEYDFKEESKHTEDLSVSEIKRHAQFITLTFEHDIALLKLKRSIKYSKFVGSICLPEQKGRDYSDVKGTVVGWGTVSFGGAASPVLRQVTIPVWKNEDCDRTYLLENIGDSFMCAGSPEKGEDACQGDSGGPLMTLNENGRWEVIGLVSWGRRCGDPTYPGVYTRVTTYLDWIKQNAV